MPTVDQLAQHGVTFTQAIAASSWTLPSIMSLLTGVYPSRHKITNKQIASPADESGFEVRTLGRLAPTLMTLAQALQQQGYRTAGFTGGTGVSRQFGFDQGFERYDDDLTFGGFRDTVPRALDWIQEHRNEKLFVLLHGYDCHGQYEPPGGLDHRYAPSRYDGRYAGTAVEQQSLREEGLEKSELFLRDADQEFWKGVYAEKVARADQEFARFVAAYEDFGLMDNTIFVITSDHGEELMEHGRLDHGATLYEELVRIPLIVAVPQLAAPLRIARQVRSIDVLPTLLHLLSINPPEPLGEQMQGINVLDPDAASTEAVMETDYRYAIFLKALRTTDGESWKLVVNVELGTTALYDLSRDPGERRNLASSHQRKTAELDRRLRVLVPPDAFVLPSWLTLHQESQ